MRRRPYRRRGHVYDWNRIYMAAAWALLALCDIWLLSHLDGLSSALPVALRQPLVAVVLVGVALLPALALRAAETALRPRLQHMAPATRSDMSTINRAPAPGLLRQSRLHLGASVRLLDESV